jgi:hypothetical protein
MKSKHPSGPPMTLGNMRKLGVRGLLISCLNHECRHQTVVSVDDYADDITVPSFIPQMECKECGSKRVDVRPNWKEQQSPGSLTGKQWQ